MFSWSYFFRCKYLFVFELLVELFFDFLSILHWNNHVLLITLLTREPKSSIFFYYCANIVIQKKKPQGHPFLSSLVQPIFNDISNSDNCCYNDRFANPRTFLSLSHVIYFYNNEYKNRFPLL